MGQGRQGLQGGLGRLLDGTYRTLWERDYPWLVWCWLLANVYFLSLPLTWATLSPYSCPNLFSIAALAGSSLMCHDDIRQHYQKT